jgi:hypothetical protein
VETIVGRQKQLLMDEVEEALLERGLAQTRFDAAVGTSTEMGAYLRLRRAAQRVTAADRAARGPSADWREVAHV